jgi:hypothetical protein
MEIYKMKKTVAIILIVVMALSLCACGAKEEAAPATLGQQLYHEFNAKVEGGEKDVQALADALLQSGMLPFDGLSMEVEPGWLMGFTADVEGFEKGVMFGPAIGAIPFVAYVFQLDGSRLCTIVKAENNVWYGTEGSLQDCLVISAAGDFRYVEGETHQFKSIYE